LDHIIIFIKNAELGKVKTRIAKDVGDEEALEIYKSLLAITNENVSQIDGIRHLYYSNIINQNDQWPDQKYSKRLQFGNDLGERMSNAFKEVFSIYNDIENKVVIIGSDCPEIDANLIHSAFERLSEFDVVIGPTFDGGYYLMGMNKYEPELFNNIEWSTTTVFDETIKLVVKNKLSYFILPKLQDIDHIEDWDNYLSK
jgi:hypothetical protein